MYLPKFALTLGRKRESNSVVESELYYCELTHLETRRIAPNSYTKRLVNLFTTLSAIKPERIVCSWHGRRLWGECYLQVGLDVIENIKPFTALYENAPSEDMTDSEYRLPLTTALLALRPWPQETRPLWPGAAKATAASVAKTRMLLKAISIFSKV